MAVMSRQHLNHRRAFLIALLLLVLSTSSHAVSSTDSARLGSQYTSMPLYRNGAGTNVLTVGVGTPEVVVNLTCSTNVAFFVIATTSCGDCTQNSNTFDITSSTSLTTSQRALDYTFIYPAGTLDTISIGGQLGSEVLTDERGEDTTRPIDLVATIQENDKKQNLEGTSFTWSDGTAGFWGMGVYQDDKSLSMISAMTQVAGDGTPSQTPSVTVGFDINNYSTDSTVLAGTVHRGGVPDGSYDGDFNWLNVNTSVGGSWGFGLDSMRVENTVIDLSETYGSIDPGFDAIYVPSSIAEKFFSKVSGALRDAVDTTRWNLPCDTNISMTLTVFGTEYAISSSQLVQNRDTAGVFCWGSVVAWQNGSVAEAKGEVRFGTPFMSNVYTALYYSDSNQYVGIAGKPNSVNASNLVKRSEGHRNAKLAGILIGTLMGVLILLFLICYSRNRNSFQSVWYRAIRRQNRAQMNMMARAATLPPVPPMMPMPMMGPPPTVMAPGMPMPMPMPMMVNPAMQGAPYPYQPVPPPYQMPITRDPGFIGNYQSRLAPQPQQPQGQGQGQGMPRVIEQQPQGYCSPRQQPISTTSASHPLATAMTSRAHAQEQQQVPLLASAPGPYTHRPGVVPACASAAESSRVRWGITGARKMRPSFSSAASGGRSGSVDEFGAFAAGPTTGRYPHPQHPGARGSDVRAQRHEDFMRRYTGAGQLPVGMQRTSAPPAPNYHPASSGVEGSDKKRYFAWRGGGGNGSEYEPVGPTNMAPSDGGKRRSWFSGLGRPASASGGREGWKDIERARERERLRSGGVEES